MLKITVLQERKIYRQIQIFRTKNAKQGDFCENRHTLGGSPAIWAGFAILVLHNLMLSKNGKQICKHLPPPATESAPTHKQKTTFRAESS